MISPSSSSVETSGGPIQLIRKEIDLTNVTAGDNIGFLSSSFDSSPPRFFLGNVVGMESEHTESGGGKVWDVQLYVPTDSGEDPSNRIGKRRKDSSNSAEEKLRQFAGSRFRIERDAIATVQEGLIFVTGLHFGEGK
jgi:hypothetical protein